ncbi:helix-turn-helix domain-containing protein [Sphingomonas sp. BGYR3]|uniref:winged helix-turn-helix transcriptional regulator n=1 Tax=Sphingomonas sp. BGYR3 TaxID=2975483 RepID=UPI0021A6E44E|nr:helix-turn-helix domain-containing protein [Sphingomonas sp. BGYR3]MDG5489103.1 helix-turn-helix domain-containing protein [Sphingomonas sp. BGYR3]
MQFVPDVLNERCGSRLVLNHVTSRWGGLVLIALLDGTLRFSSLRRRIGGVSERMLTQSLRLLERDGLIERIAHQVVPPHVDYRLSPMGRDVAEKVLALAQCIEGNLDKIMEFREAGAEGAATAD